MLSLKVLPGLCHHYHDRGCTKGDLCNYLHICQFLVKHSKCTKGRTCTTNHSLIDKDEKILRAHGLTGDKSEILVHYLRLMSQQVATSPSKPGPGGHANPGAIAKQRAERPDGSGVRPHPMPKSIEHRSTAVVKRKPATKVICVHFLEGKCSFGGNCVKIHPEGKRPFVWRFRMTPGSEDAWEEFDPNTNVQLETAFCDPNQSTCSIRLQESDLVIDLRTKKTRGLTNPICVERLVTQDIDGGWKWYMQYPAGPGNWKDLSKKCLDVGVELSINSEYLEATYITYKKLNESFGQYFNIREANSDHRLLLDVDIHYDSPDMTAVTDHEST